MSARDSDPKRTAEPDGRLTEEADLFALFASTLGASADSAPAGVARRTPSRVSWGGFKTALLATLVGGTALMPLYGDPRATPVTHPLWARMLLRAMDMSDAVRISDQASEVFSALSWRSSLGLTAERFLRSEGVRVVQEGGHTRVTPIEGVGEVMYPLAVVRGGDYRLRVRMASDSATPASAEITAMGATEPVRAFTLAGASQPGWVLAGTTHLDPGSYTASLLLPAGASVEYVEVAPPCVNAVEPVGGWSPTAVVRAEDVAVTALKALDREDELPPSDTPIEIEATAFQLDEPAVLAAAMEEGSDGLVAGWLKADEKGLRALVFADIPQPGLYTVSVFGMRGRGQSWLGDGCRKAVLCPALSAADDGAGWRVVMSQEFKAGRHHFTVTLGEGAAIQRLRLERKKDGPADYVATLRRLGFDAGPDGPVTRQKATEAMRFIRDRHREGLALCGDIELPDRPPQLDIMGTQVATGAGAAATTTASAPPAGGRPQPPPPFGTALVPLELQGQETASPVLPVLPQG